MESSPHLVVSPELKITEYHSRKMVQAFYGVGAVYGYLFLEKENVFLLGKSSRETHFLAQIQNNFGTFESQARSGHPVKIATWTEEKDQLQAILYRLPSDELFIFAVVVQRVGVEYAKSRWNFLSHCLSTYLSIGVSNRAKSLLSFRSFTEVFRKKVCESMHGLDSGVLSLFYLQDLSPFFKPLGIVKSQEILREVSSTLQAAARPGELFFQLNVRSFYLFCPGEILTRVNERMEGIYFPSKHMILDYKLKLFLVSKEVALDPNQFSDLFMEIL
jgi:hypothetical protein